MHVFLLNYDNYFSYQRLAIYPIVFPIKTSNLVKIIAKYDILKKTPVQGIISHKSPSKYRGKNSLNYNK